MLIVVDCMLARALSVAAGTGTPVVVLVHSFPSFFAGPYARGPIGMLTALRGLRLGRLWAQADATVATVLPSMEPSRTGPWSGLVAVGPVTPTVSERLVVPKRERERARVLVSLSTVWYPGQDRTLQRILDAIAPLDLDALVTTGRSIDPASLRAPANAEVHRFVDHDAVLPSVDLVVGHGGHGTTMRALGSGIPLVVIPGFALTDQPYVGQRVAAAGAGALVRKSASVDAIRRAIGALAAPGGHRDAAQRISAELADVDPAGAAVRVLERTAARGRQSSVFSAQ